MRLPTSLHAAVGALVAWLALTGSARAQACPEPSALDVVPAAEPLRVALAPGPRILLTWQDVGVRDYVVYEGSLDSLAAFGDYDHLWVDRPTASATELAVASGSRYYLVQAACGTDGSSVGRDSFGRERPSGAIARLRVGLSGGADVFGAHVEVGYPSSLVTISESGIAFVGPFDAAAPGAPYVLAGVRVEGEAHAAAMFTLLDPDPSFDPEPAGVTEILQLDFAARVVPPALGDFTLLTCEVRDALGNLVPAVACFLTEIDFLAP